MDERCLLHPSTRRLAAAALLATGAAFAQAAPDLATRSLAATCAACHGTDGQALADEGFARLAGMPAADIVARLRGFRDGSRPATVMHQLGKGYSDAQIDALAAYFASRR